MKFELMGGTHVAGGKRYKRGDIIDSETDLTTVFRGKFRRVYKEELEERKAKTQIQAEEARAKSKPEIPTPDSAVEGDATPEASPKAAEEPEEQAAEEKSTKVENIAELDDEDQPAEEAVEPEAEELVEHPDYGIKVNNKFPLSKKKAIDVYVKNHWYTLVDPDDGNKLSKKKLRKDAVNIALDEFEDDNSNEENSQE